MKKSKKPTKKRKSKNNQINKLTYIFVALFMCMMGYFIYFQIFVGENVINNTYNKRQEVFESIVKRGNIQTEDGEILAKTETDSEGNEKRVYPYGNVFSHAVGIATHGKSGIELSSDYNLLAADVNIVEKISNEFKDEKTDGNNVVTTVKTNLQQVAYEALGDNDGAVIALDPETGKIYAMVSKPDFDPNLIDEQWDAITSEDGNSCLLNRATNGIYTPGSTFKIFTFLEYIRENKNFRDYSYYCNGRITIGNNSVSCYNGHNHGTVDLFKSFAYSCNSSFINIGTELDVSKYSAMCSELFFNGDLPTKLEYKPSRFSLDADSTTFDIMQTVIGQGKTQVSPLHMAIIASAIANDGVVMEPYLVTYIENHNGFKVKKYSPVKYGKIFADDEVELLKEAMSGVVAYGTGTKLQNSLYDAYGKTGTAEIDSGDNAHSWFVGYAEHEGKKLAICVLMENMPPGSTWAVPAAKTVFDTYFSE